MITANRIVVGVDGSKPSRQALLWARFLAGATGSSIQAVAAWEPFFATGYVGPGYSAVPIDWNPEQDRRQVLDAAIEEAFGEATPDGLERTVAEGGAARVLLDLSIDARMLVVGSRGHGGFTGLLLGSVSAACAEHAGCPVLVVHGATPPPPPVTGAVS